jgi:DNA replication protein DnaC
MDKTGLLLFGGVGRGKTHLAVGIIRELMLTKGIQCLFWDYSELLRLVQNSYSSSTGTSELKILQPVFDAEILVLDDLGSTRPSGWVWDTVSLILNTRYNKRSTTIITTNFPDGPPGERRKNLPSTSIEFAQQANKEETLGDRITERMRSRIHEMCRMINIDSSVPDYRSKSARRR